MRATFAAAVSPAPKPSAAIDNPRPTYAPAAASCVVRAQVLGRATWLAIAGDGGWSGLSEFTLRGINASIGVTVRRAACRQPSGDDPCCGSPAVAPVGDGLPDGKIAAGINV